MHLPVPQGWRPAVAAGTEGPHRPGLLRHRPRALAGARQWVARPGFVDIGVITTPPGAAQKVCDSMVRAGLRAVLNFAPVRVRAPENVLVKTVDLKVHLEELSFFLAHAEAGSD